MRGDLARRELGCERTGPLAEQHSQPIRSDGLCGDQRRNRRFSRGPPRRRARDVELAAAAELEPHAGEVERLLLIPQVRARDGQALLRAAQLDVVARDLGRDEHLRVAQIRDRRVGLGARRFDAAAYAAEKVELPQRRKARIVTFDVDAVGREPWLLLLALRARDLRGHARPTVAPRGASESARLFDARGRDREIEIGRQRALDQRVERGIAKLLPPRGLERLLVHAGRRRRDERRRGSFGRTVVGTDGARS